MTQHIPIRFASILIVGLARNCENIIQGEIRKINSAFANFRETNWIVVESDSDDDTVSKLEDLKAELNIEIITLGKIRNDFPIRTQRIAVCRNEYVKAITSNERYQHVDYVVIADLDGVNRDLTAKSVESCWLEEHDWDACFANQSAPYYDIWALRHDDWCPNDCYKHEVFLKLHGIDDYTARVSSILSRMIKIKQSEKPIEVKSAFGGLGIYKKELFGNFYYSGLDKNGDEVCEHVSFHKHMSKTSKLVIMPSLVNAGYTEHSERSKWYYKLALYLATRFFTIDTLKKIKMKLLY